MKYLMNIRNSRWSYMGRNNVVLQQSVPACSECRARQRAAPPQKPGSGLSVRRRSKVNFGNGFDKASESESDVRDLIAERRSPVVTH
ncbi:hypothetical protein C8Q74DRAFT_485212 [Fomes fomentarius]|nr:hypothetical protein C8Q74DRAFT_485212 [Fomes fomentarius]